MGIFSNITDALHKRNEEEEAQKAAIASEVEKIRQATNNIRNGAIPEPMQSDGQLILDSGEKIYVILPGLRYLEERTSRVNYSGSGVSVRVAKGVSIRTGGGTATPVRELQFIDTGSLYITDKKVAFIGTKKSVVFPLKKIVECNRTKDGMHIASSTKKTPIIVVNNGSQHQEIWDYTDATVKALIAHAG